MSSKSHKIQAFTLSEMLVVLLLTLIVVGLAFSVLQLVQKHMFAIKKNFTNSTTVTLLEQSLWIDANRSSTIKIDAEDIVFMNEMDTITYHFEKENIIKENDTFSITVADKFYYFEGKETTEKSIDAMKLVLSKEFQHRTIFVFKQNDAEIFMNP